MSGIQLRQYDAMIELFYHDFGLNIKIPTRNKKKKAVKAMNIILTLQYTDEIPESNKGDAEVILIDNFRCHHNGHVLEKITNLEHKGCIFRPNAPTELSPCASISFKEMRTIYRSMHRDASKKDERIRIKSQ